MITRKDYYKRIYKSAAGVLTSKYGAPRPDGRTHAGEDSDITYADDHPKIYAPVNCVVTHARNVLTDDRGKFLELKLGPSLYLILQHDYQISVKDGQRVAEGTLIAVQGGSGRTLNQYKSHIHHEWARYPYGDPRRKPINPNLYFYPLFTPPKYTVKTVVVDGLRIRSGASLTAPKVGTAGKQAYTIFETVTADGFVWGRIDWVLDQWIALRSADGTKVFAK